MMITIFLRIARWLPKRAWHGSDNMPTVQNGNHQMWSFYPHAAGRRRSSHHHLLEVYSVYIAVGALKWGGGGYFKFITYTEANPAYTAYLFHRISVREMIRVCCFPSHTHLDASMFFDGNGRFPNSHSNQLAISLLPNNGNLCRHQTKWVVCEIFP